jgi:hypothetical protein
VKTGSVYRITAQGTLTQTGNKLDLAIDGKGFFPVLTPAGDTAYTRAGNFSVNDQGQILDPQRGEHDRNEAQTVGGESIGCKPQSVERGLGRLQAAGLPGHVVVDSISRDWDVSRGTYHW